MKKLSAALFAVSFFCLLFALLITSVFTFAASEDFYNSEYDKIGQAEAIGIAPSDLAAVTHGLLEYTKGELPDLDMQYEVKGELREIFDEREKAHMVDVQALFIGARTTMIICWCAAGAALIGGILASACGALRRLAVTWLWTGAGFILIVAAIGGYAAADFNAFWTFFHEVFFTNDLWLLDPAVSIMINMFPAQFFSDMVGSIIGMFAGIYVAAMSGCGAVVIVGNHKHKAVTDDVG